MPSPISLTLCDPPKIDWSRAGTPAASDFGDIYFSVDGGLEEARAVFLRACGLPEQWEGRDYFAIGELGFGTGLNFLATWQLWEQQDERSGRMHFISVEKYPLDKAQLVQALGAWPELAKFSAELIEQWPGRVKGFHHLEFGDVSLTLIHDDILDGLRGISGKMDAWYLDGFSPAKNPGMWSPEVFHLLAGLSNPGAKVGTFTVARSVREGLRAAGFEVSKKEGFGRKSDRLEAMFGEVVSSIALQTIEPVIIGAGIAGASLTSSFLKRGIVPTVIDPNDGSGASGNAAAIVKPRLDIQDRPESRFFLSSYLYALQCYVKTQSVIHEGVQHLCLDEKQAQRFAKILNNSPLPTAHLAKSASSVAGDAIEFPKGLVVDPGKLKSEMLARAKMVSGQRKDIANLETHSHVIWACGYGIRELDQFSELELRYSRGQVTLVKAELERVVTYGNYAIPMDGDVLIGATHKRLDDQSPFDTRNSDDEENIAKFKAVSEGDCEVVLGKSRSSVGVTTASTLPLIIGGGKEWGLTGLGSRGFVFAPLLAEAIVARICGEVLPISNRVWTRFRAREKIQPENAPKKTPDNQ